MRIMLAVCAVVLNISIASAQEIPFIEIDHFEYGRIVTIAWHPYGGVLTVAGEKGVQLFTDTGESITHIDDFDAEVTALAWNPDGSTLAVATLDNTLSFWTYHAGAFVIERTFPIEGEIVYGLAYSPDGTSIAAVSNDEFEQFSDGYRIYHRLRVYDAAAGAVIFESELSGGMLSQPGTSMIQWSEDGQKLLTFGGEYRARVAVYDTDTWDVVADSEYIEDIMALAADPTLEYIIASGGGLEVYDDPFSRYIQIHIANGNVLELLGRQEVRAWVNSLAWHSKQNLVASADESGDVKVWRLGDDHNLAPVSTLRAHLTSVKLAAWDTDSMQLASVGTDDTILIWKDVEHDYSPAENVPQLTFEIPDSSRDFNWSADGRWIVVAHEDHLLFHDSTTGELVHTLTFETDYGIQYFQFSEDGSRLMVQADDFIRVFDVTIQRDKEALTQIVEYKPDDLFSASLSPDGQQVAIAVGFSSGPSAYRIPPDPYTFIWEINTGKIDGLHTGPVHSPSWSPDGSMLLVGHQGSPWAHIHDVETDTIQAEFSGTAPWCCGSGYGTRGIDWQANTVVMNTWGRIDLWQITRTEGGVETSNEINIWRKVIDVQLSPDGTLLAALGDLYDAIPNLYVWDTETGEALRLIVVDAWRFAWSPDGNVIATLGPDRDTGTYRIDLWEIR